MGLSSKAIEIEFYRDEEIELLRLCNNNIIEEVKNTQINSVITKVLFSKIAILKISIIHTFSFLA